MSFSRAFAVLSEVAWGSIKGGGDVEFSLFNFYSCGGAGYQGDL